MESHQIRIIDSLDKKRYNLTHLNLITTIKDFLLERNYEINIEKGLNTIIYGTTATIIKNGERVVYAKKSRVTGGAETGTKAFVSNSMAVLEQRTNFKPKSKDKFTVVVWIEGDDPECKNDLLGGEIKLHMDITEEHVDNNKKIVIKE